MKKLYSLILAMFVASATAVSAQDIVTTSPAPLQEDSENVVITYHPNLGNKGLKGSTAAQTIYAHTGVITNKSNGSWAYAPEWKDNDPKYALKYVDVDVWQLEMGDLRTYYGITDPDEHIEQLCFVFRNATASKEGKTATGGDIFVNVLEGGFQMEFTSDSPLVLNSETSTVKFTARTTADASISIYIGSTDGTPIASLDNGKELVTTYTFPEGDSYDVIAVAKKNGSSTIATQTLSVCYPPNSKAKAYPGGTPKMGANAEANGDVTFCIAAPGKVNAMIIPSWDGYKAKAKNVMNYTDINGIRYFWITVSGLDPDTEYVYYYLIDETIQVGDPYARLVLDPYSDKWLADGTYPGLIKYPQEVEGNVMLAVYKGTRDNYDWQVKDFTPVPADQLMVYELLIRDFTGTDGKALGDGTLRKAMEKIPYLQNLGVTAVELMPIQEFNGNNSWGYNTNFYFAPDKAYGSPDDYREFIDKCHQAGLAVILDVVFNQSDGLHPWYQMYPTNSNPFYNARAPHAYSVLNDWNQDNLLVQQQWHDMIRYWMTAYKVDGFRFDLVKGLGDNESYGGNASDANTNKYNASRVARMKALTETIRSINPNAYSINENLAGAQEENEMAANGSLNWANINNASCQFAMGYSSDSNTARFYAPSDSRTWGSTVSYAESHDEERVAYKQNKWGVSGVKGNLPVEMRRCGSLAAQIILPPGAHMIWQFGELGDDESTKDANGGNNTDPKIVVWNYLNDPDRAGLMESYRELLHIRKNNPDLFAQGCTYSAKLTTSAWANGRFINVSNGDKELICVINPTLANLTAKATFKQTSNDAYKILSKSFETDPTFNAATGDVTLAPGAYVVIGNKAMVGKEDPAIDNVAAGAAARVFGAEGHIVIEGEYTNATVYALDGRAASSLAVPAGMYIVNVDGVATKVVVK